MSLISERYLNREIYKYMKVKETEREQTMDCFLSAIGFILSIMQGLPNDCPSSHFQTFVISQAIIYTLNFAFSLWHLRYIKYRDKENDVLQGILVILFVF